MRTALHGLVALMSARAQQPEPWPTTIYRWVDAQGVVHYSDTPHPGAQNMQITGRPDLPRPRPRQPTRPYRGRRRQATRRSYESCAITQPAPDAVLVRARFGDCQLGSSPRSARWAISYGADGRHAAAAGRRRAEFRDPAARARRRIPSAPWCAMPMAAWLCNATPVTFSCSGPR